MASFASSFPFPLGGNLPCDVPPCSQAIFITVQDFLNLFDRLLPLGYLDPIKNIGPGYEVLQAYSKIAQRLSLAVARLDCGAHILSSFGGTLATGIVTFTRPSASAGAVTIKTNTLVTTSKGHRDFVVLNDVVFGIGDVGPHSVFVAAVAPGFEYNVPGEVITADKTVLPGEIDTIKYPILEPPYGDTSFVVHQPLEICGGQPSILDALGEDRGLPRNSSENDDDYKARIRTLPDTVSPDAIVRTLHASLDPRNIPFDHIETWQIDYQTCWDAPSPNSGTPTFQSIPPTNPLFDSNLFVYDDPRPVYPPFRNRWLDEIDYRGAVIIVLPNIGAVSDVGMAYDDTAMNAQDLITPNTGGTRAMSAYDVVFSTPVQQGGYDGFDLGKNAIYKGIFDLLEKTKAAGIVIELELQGQ